MQPGACPQGTTTQEENTGDILTQQIPFVQPETMSGFPIIPVGIGVAGVAVLAYLFS